MKTRDIFVKDFSIDHRTEQEHFPIFVLLIKTENENLSRQEE